MGRKRQPHSQSRTIKQDNPAPAIEFKRGLVIVAILVITFLSFANSIDNKFAYDDQTQILSNELIRDFGNLPTAFTKEVWFWRVLQDQDPNKEMGPTTPYYRPMFTVYLMAGWWMFKDWPQPWHLLNVLMHLIAVLFVFLILHKVTSNLQMTAIATILFAVHPLRVESVAWISGVTDLFLAIFLLPSFYLYMLFRESSSIVPRIMYLSGSLLLFLVAAFSKEPAVALPIFIVAYEVLILNRGESFTTKLLRGAAFGLIFFAVSVVYFSMRYKALGFVFHHANYTAHPFDAVIYTIPLVVCKYLMLLIWPFWPVKLSLFHATYLVRSPLSLKFILPLLAVIAIAFALWRLRNSSVARFAILWFGIHLLPVLNLSAFAEDFMVQERYVYIPSVGFSLLIAMGLVNFPYEKLTSWYSRKRLQTAVVTAIAVAMIVTTLAQNNVWEDDLTLWEYGAEAAPDQTMPHFILGHKNISRNQPMEVVENLENYMKLDTENAIVVSNLAAAHLFAYELTNDRAHIDRSIALSEKGLKLTDKYAPLWDTLGRAYTFNTDIKNYSRAHYFFDQALKLQPENAMINFHKGATYALEQKLDPAMQYLETARRLEPDLPDVYKFMGYVYRARKQNQEAINSFNTYLRMVPGGQEDKEVRKVIEELQTQARNEATKS